MEEVTLKLSQQEVDMIVSLIKQVSISPASPEALTIVVACQGVLSKVAEATKKE